MPSEHVDDGDNRGFSVAMHTGDDLIVGHRCTHTYEKCILFSSSQARCSFDAEAAHDEQRHCGRTEVVVAEAYVQQEVHDGEDDKSTGQQHVDAECGHQQ